MISYNKNIYPELEKSDFDEHITPLLSYICKLDSHSSSELKNVSVFQTEEVYPYQNPCKLIVTNVLEKMWLSEFNDYLLNSDDFKEKIYQQFSSVIFSYLIRCFSEDIKTFCEKDFSPTDTYKLYCQHLMESGFKEFSKKYPVAWSRSNILLKNKAKAIINILKNINKHRLEIEATFSIKTSSKIESISTEGDTHNKGTSVAIITFENNEKLVFKPRSVSGELAYSKLIEKLNKFISPSLLSLSVIDFGEYGFTSFVETDEENISMFESGRLACLMYLLNATDMHYSNILWTKEGPMPIDLETLFHPSRVRKGIAESKESAYKLLGKSVYGTGILPILISNKDNSRSVDVGFTGIRDQNSSSPFKMFDIVDGFSSTIKVVWQKEQVINNELISNSDVEMYVFERCEQIISGFKSLFNQIFNQRNQFTYAVLEAFKNTKFRYIHNMTYRYTQLLRSLTDAAPSKDIDIAHSLLSRMGILSMSSDPKIVESECKQLWDGDIPYFSINFKSEDIFCGEEVVSHLSISPENDFLQKMQDLSEKDLVEQLRLIRLAFVAKLADPHSDGKIPDSAEVENNPAPSLLKDNVKNDTAPKSHEAIIQWFADYLTDSILDDRYKHLPKTWIGPVARYGGQGWSPGVLGYDLYAGRIGPALSLAVSGKLLSDRVALNAATDIFERSANILSSKTYELRNVLLSGTGAFSGVSGLLWSLYAAGDLLNNESWKEISLESWKLINFSANNSNLDFFDMINGVSASLIMRKQLQPEYEISDNLIEQSISSAESKLLLRSDSETSGLAHGYGQLLWFFSKLGQTKQNAKIDSISQKIISVLENEYRTEDGLLTVYSNNLTENISSSWCNGLAGLLIAYYEAYKANYVSRDTVVNLINQIKTIPLSRIPVLCHGSLGIMEALNYVKESFQEEVTDILKILGSTYCSPEYIYKYYKNGKGRYPLSPGIMSGRAGALLYLCKSLDSSVKISPLTFEV